LENNLWVGGVLCSLLYIATVRVLRDPIFMYAVEVGVSLTVLLFLPITNINIDATTLSIGLMTLGLISIHCERAFARSDDGFSRKRFGMPLFWSGQIQVGVALLILLGSQIFSWLAGPITKFYAPGFQGNMLTSNPLLAGLLWMCGVYLYLYCDLVVRRVGFYLYGAAFCLLMAIVTLVGWQLHSTEAVIIALAIVALAANLAQSNLAKRGDKLSRLTAPIGLILSGIPLLIGWVIHLRALSSLWGADVPIEWIYVVAMLAVTISARISAHLSRTVSTRHAAVYLAFSAAGLLLAAAGLLPLIGIDQWAHQAPILMLIPIGYIVAARLWRGKSPELPLGWIAHAATGIILFHVFFRSLQQIVVSLSRSTSEQPPSPLMGLVFAQVALFYVLAGLIRKRSVNAYFAAVAACGAAWQWMGYFEIPGRYYALAFAVVGLSALAAARFLGVEQITIYRANGKESLSLHGRGLTAFQSGNAILSIALMSAFFQQLVQLINGSTSGIGNAIFAVTTCISVAGIWIVPTASWRRIYTSASIALGALGILTISIDWFKAFSLGQKFELISVATGVVLLIASYIARFRKSESKNEMVDIGLLLGSMLAALPLLVAVVYHRWWSDSISLYDELAVLTVTILMLVTGYSWQTRSPTLIGGGCLILYLIVMVAELAGRAQELLGVSIFMTLVGGLVFGAGIVLSIYREKLLKLPDKIAKREGVFRIVSWR
jgi:hypothetical protein